jgi:hypothetical protein
MSNSAFSQSAAPSSFADLTGVPDDNAALAAALAGKADVLESITPIAGDTAYDSAHAFILHTRTSVGYSTYTLPAAVVNGKRLVFFNNANSTRDLVIDGNGKAIQGTETADASPITIGIGKCITIVGSSDADT